MSLYERDCENFEPNQIKKYRPTPEFQVRLDLARTIQNRLEKRPKKSDIKKSSRSDSSNAILSTILFFRISETLPATRIVSCKRSREVPDYPLPLPSPKWEVTTNLAVFGTLCGS